MVFTHGVTDVPSKGASQSMYKLTGKLGPRSVGLGNGPLDQYLRSSSPSYSAPVYSVSLPHIPTQRDESHYGGKLFNAETPRTFYFPGH